MIHLSVCVGDSMNEMSPALILLLFSAEIKKLLLDTNKLLVLLIISDSVQLGLMLQSVRLPSFLFHQFVQQTNQNSH